MPTHIVENQPPPLYNHFTSDAALTEAFEREASGCDRAELVEIGDLAGRPETIQLGFDANANPPELHTHDRLGNRIDEVRFHPAWHALMRSATQRGLTEAPLNSIWEGSGNINALDVLRIVQRQPESFEALRDEIMLAGDEPRIASECARMESELRGNSAQLEARARALTERLALLWQASLLVRYAPSATADAFITSRLGSSRDTRTLGTLGPGSALAAIVERASPAPEPVGVS